MKKLMIFLKGIVVGVSNIIPGVSGGTMAVVTNVYDLMVDILSFKFSIIKKRWLEALFLVLGMVFGIIAFSHVLEFLLTSYAKQCNWFFSGIVIGTVPFLVAKSKAKRPRITSFLSFTFMLAIMIVIFIFSGDAPSADGEVMKISVGTFAYMILAGFVGAFSMIVPGISGSFMMVVMGTYTTVLKSISDLNIIMLIPFGIGALIGIIVGARIIKWLLKRFPEQTYFGILGLIIGSVPTLAGADGTVLVILLIIGAATSYLFGKSELKE